MHTLDRDRNYFLGSDANIYRIVGDSHNEFVTAYVKYTPNETGNKVLEGTTYKTTPNVRDSFNKLAQTPGAIRHSTQFGFTVTGRERSRITRWFDARESIEYILENPFNTARIAVAEFMKQLEKRGINTGNIGVTGSMQIGFDSDSSDIDLVCYGKDCANSLREACAELLIPYLGADEDKLLQRRISHMPSIPANVLVYQERRKIQGLWKGRHLNIQPLREQPYVDPHIYSDMGAVSVVGIISNTDEAAFAPAYYEVNKTQIIDSETRCSTIDITKIISSIGAYSQILLPGERFFAVGNLIRGEHARGITYAVSIDPWNRGFNNKLQLVL